MTPRCRCHGEPMERNPGSVGGWRCVIRRRIAQRAYTERIGKNVRRIRAGDTYLGLAKTTEEADAINEHVRQRLTDFKRKQKEEQDGWRDRQTVA